MKNFIIMLTLFSCLFGKSQTEAKSIYSESFKLKMIDGSDLDLSTLKGKYILFVNVASECGFTPQYQGLQKLSEDYKENLVVIGVPCNQFGGQEPGSAEEIQQFCSSKFHVTFPMSEKAEVKGSSKHPLYAWLTSQEKNGVSSSSVKWNFQKYLINPEGMLVDYFYSTTKPNSSKILDLIK